ncbi:MAG: DUF2332 family protein [Thalassobaculum sp.]|uniref:DUF2332 domain-containing protein n=1 Tax=Thalassobaculum sp. TaxID=2022740 RepID=UPI0032F067ED
MPLPAPIAQAFDRQAAACHDLGSPFNALLCETLRTHLSAESRFGRRVHDWPGQPVEDALALRVCGGLHALSRSGRCPTLAAAYPPAEPDTGRLREAVEAALDGHDDFLCDWLDSPPQTNEVSRSASILGGCLSVGLATGLPLEVYEIGSSAGLNLGFDRWHYDLGIAEWGSEASGVRIVSRCEGRLPLDAPLTVVHREGCDRNPLDPRSAADRERLLSYIWPGQAERSARIAAALKMAAEAGWRVERTDAAEWVEDRFARPGTPGRTRVLVHTIVWQYLPTDTQRRIEAAIRAAGTAATARSPVAWLRIEPDGVQGSAGVRLTLWPDGETRLLGRADFHGRWHRWDLPS